MNLGVSPDLHVTPVMKFWDLPADPMFRLFRTRCKNFIWRTIVSTCSCHILSIWFSIFLCRPLSPFLQFFSSFPPPPCPAPPPSLLTPPITSCCNSASPCSLSVVCCNPSFQLCPATCASGVTLIPFLLVATCVQSSSSRKNTEDRSYRTREHSTRIVI